MDKLALIYTIIEMDCEYSISNFDLSVYLLSLSKYYSCFGISETRFSGQSERDRETVRTFRIVNFDREKSPSRLYHFGKRIIIRNRLLNLPCFLERFEPDWKIESIIIIIFNFFWRRLREEKF